MTSQNFSIQLLYSPDQSRPDPRLRARFQIAVTPDVVPHPKPPVFTAVVFHFQGHFLLCACHRGCWVGARPARLPVLALGADAALLLLGVVVHPAHAVQALLDGEDLARVLLDAAVAFPQRERLVGRGQLRPEVWRLVLAEEDLEAVELLAVAGGDGDFDLDRGAFVVDGAGEGAREGFAYFEGGEELECEGDAGGGDGYVSGGLWTMGGEEGGWYR